MRYIVTGAQGFVGRYLVNQLLAQDPSSHVTGLGRSPRCDRFFTHKIKIRGHRRPAPLPPSLCQYHHERYAYVSLDINKTGSLVSFINDFSPDVVFHLASGLRDDAPEKLCRTNIEGTLSLLRAISDSTADPRKIVLGSSGGVYGRPSQLPILESDTCVPVDMYGVTKLASELISAVLAQQFQLPVCWARIFNIVGPGQEERHVAGRFAAELMTLRRNNGRHLGVGRLDTTRDFIDVRDVADALIRLAELGSPMEAYNIGSGRETPIREVFELLCSQLERDIVTTQALTRTGEIERHFASIEKLEKLGFQPQHELHQSLRDVWAYYVDQERI